MSIYIIRSAPLGDKGVHELPTPVQYGPQTKTKVHFNFWS